MGLQHREKSIHNGSNARPYIQFNLSHNWEHEQQAINDDLIQWKHIETRYIGEFAWCRHNYGVGCILLYLTYVWNRNRLKKVNLLYVILESGDSRSAREGDDLLDSSGWDWSGTRGRRSLSDGMWILPTGTIVPAAVEETNLDRGLSFVWTPGDSSIAGFSL